MTEYAYLRDGSVLGRVTGWDGDVPIIDTTDRLPGPSSTDLAGDADTPRSRDARARSEAPGHPLPPGSRDSARHSAGSVRDPAAGRYPAAGIRAVIQGRARRV